MANLLLPLAFICFSSALKEANFENSEVSLTVFTQRPKRAYSCLLLIILLSLFIDTVIKALNLRVTMLKSRGVHVTSLLGKFMFILSILNLLNFESGCNQRRMMLIQKQLCY